MEEPQSIAMFNGFFELSCRSAWTFCLIFRGVLFRGWKKSHGNESEVRREQPPNAIQLP